MAKSLSDFKVTKRSVEPYELDLEDGSDAVVFQNPNKLPSRLSFEVADERTPPKRSLEVLLGDDFERAWAVLGDLETDRLAAILKDVTNHFRVSDS